MKRSDMRGFVAPIIPDSALLIRAVIEKSTPSKCPIPKS